MFNPRLRMLNELEPMAENESVREFLMASIEVRIPTKAVMPIAMISAVRNVRSLLLLIDCSDSLTFSLLDILTDIPLRVYRWLDHVGSQALQLYSLLMSSHNQGSHQVSAKAES